ncbi:MAG: DUF4214 domain-containing protein [Acidimicrobiales bacterium]
MGFSVRRSFCGATTPPVALANVFVAAVLAVVGAVAIQPASTGAMVEQPDPIEMVAVGDMADCPATAPAEVGVLLDELPGEILGLGDYTYTGGTAAAFANCFGPAFGRHKTRFLPAVGNHEYDSGSAQPYVDYFGPIAGDIDELYYVTQRGNWQILVLNSNCWEVGGCAVGKPQYNWLQGVLAASAPDVCRIVTMHHPRWSSYSTYGSQQYLAPMLELLEAAGTDLLLTGHSHHYERFAAQSVDAELDDKGIRQITVGTGGVALRTPDVVAPNSLVRRTDYGVLTLDLLEDSWGLEFVGVGDAGVLDRASDTCVNAPVLQVTESQAPLYRLYKAVFLRRPDQAGLDYWTGISNEGVSLMSIAGLFADSAEFTNRYSAVGDDEFLTLLYRNTLGRTPDPAGYAYWQQQMASGVDRGRIVIAFSEADEFIRRTPLR